MSAHSIKCSACGEVFASDSYGESIDFNFHDCPAIPEPMTGEPWAEYEKRCKASKLAYKAKNGGGK